MSAGSPFSIYPSIFFFIERLIAIRKASKIEDNFMSIIRGAEAILDCTSDDVFLSFLPLSHIYERALGHYIPFAHGAQIAYVEGATPMERIAKLPANFQEVRPTLFLGMPRLYEKMKEKIEDTSAKGGPLVRIYTRPDAGRRSPSGRERSCRLPLRWVP